MSVVIFLGPTLAHSDAAAYIDATFLPPVAQGDVCRALRQRPRAIGIIDGYFERVAAVWHKEILWALSRGVYVFGSASMGALRAVELAPFGMIGVGEIFAAFHRGELEDDDEVGVLHGPPDTNYKALSEPLVNIRATLAAAVAAGFATPALAEDLISIGKRLHYGSRRYRSIFAAARERGMDEASLQRLEGWLPEGAVNRKRLDAIGMLRAMRHFLGAHPEPYAPKFSFEHTEQWEAARVQALSRELDGSMNAESELLEEVKLRGDFGRLRRLALARLLACDRPENAAVQSDPTAWSRELARFRLERGLLTEEQFQAWKAAQELTESRELNRVFASESASAMAELRLEPELAAGIADELRLCGDYARLKSRARRKRGILSGAHLSRPSLSDVPISENELYAWYFEHVLGEALPQHLELFARNNGFRDLSDFQAAVLREYVFRRET